MFSYCFIIRGENAKRRQVSKVCQKNVLKNESRLRRLTQIIQLLLDALDVLLCAVGSLDGGVVARVKVIHSLARSGRACACSTEGLIFSKKELNRADEAYTKGK